MVCCLTLQGTSDVPIPAKVPVCTNTLNTSVTSDDNESASSSSNSTISVCIIPDHWRPEVEECIKGRCLTDSARSEIIRVLVTQLFASSRKPTRDDCNCHARKLILKYPFMKDDMGNGYVSAYF